MSPSRPLKVDPIAEAKRQWDLHGWGEASIGMAAVTSVMRAHQLLLARVDAALKPFGLTFARYELLALLSFTREGLLPMASATARLQVHPTSVTHTVDRLERDAMVRREPHPTDGRATLVVLTDEGRAAARKATQALNEQVFSDIRLAEGEARALVSLLARLRRNAGDFSDPVPAPDPL